MVNKKRRADLSQSVGPANANSAHAISSIDILPSAATDSFDPALARIEKLLLEGRAEAALAAVQRRAVSRPR
ncbi:MAG: hypothetical protein Fues2KO_31220 [Fuerstiella sp.]